MREVYRRRRDLVIDALAAVGIDVPPPKGTIYIWVPVPEGHTSVSFAELVLDQAAVVVSPGSAYGPNGEGYVRLSLTVADERLLEAVGRISSTSASADPTGPTLYWLDGRPDRASQRQRPRAGGGDRDRRLGRARRRASRRDARAAAYRQSQHRGLDGQRRNRPDASTYLGSGKLDELKQYAALREAEVIVCDDELSPRSSATSKIELEMRVVDRTAVILDIFAQHAHTAEGKLQVELAQLQYNMQRMRGMWKHLERLGGGVGTRGPGESQLETDRRLARQRVVLLRARLKDVAGHRELMRKRRTRQAMPTSRSPGTPTSASQRC